MEKTKLRSLAGILAVSAVWGTLSVWNFIKPADTYSLSERRKLAQKPAFSAESILSGDYMTRFDKAAPDQFPLRESFRTLKAVTALYALGKKENNGIYIADGYAAKLEYPLRDASVKGAIEKITDLYETYCKDKANNVYFSIVPDKGYFLAPKYSYPHMDYDALAKELTNGLSFAEYIDLYPTLSLSDYYKTDTHWSQERILSAANRLSTAMGGSELTDYTVKSFDTPFYGVYYGQAALPMKPDTISYIETETMKNALVQNVENGKKYTGVWEMEKLDGSDPYEVFLSGAAAVVYVENPDAETDRELILFRDSFGSSIAPLLLHNYKKITLVDTRYVRPSLLGKLVDFEGADVLFLYSTLILNQSEALQS